MQNKNKDLDVSFDNFLTVFKDSVSHIDKKYISIESAGWSVPKYAERAYCYELYHQMRVSFGDKYEYTINGELPKATHSIIRVNRSPDFLVHSAGSMDFNLVIMEVKPYSVAKTFSNINKDLYKLNYFTGKQARYHRGIMHIFGMGISKNDWCDLIHYFRSYNANLINQDKIILSLHTNSGKEPTIEMKRS